MNVMKVFRGYHAVLAVLAFLSYLTGELGLIHAWLGYGVAIVIVMRILWGLVGSSQVGFQRFVPETKGLSPENFFMHPFISRMLICGIAVSVVMSTVTGVALDDGTLFSGSDSRAGDHGTYEEFEDDDREEGVLGETHEFFANLMLFLVGIHVAYLLLFKRSMALFMLFLKSFKS